MTVSEPSVRHRLDNWRFWVGVAYFGLALVVFGLYVLFTRVSSEAARRAASQRSAAQAQVTQCVTGVKNAPFVHGFVESQRTLVTSQILATQAALAVSSTDDPLYSVRVESLGRLERALASVEKLSDLVSASTPTRAACNKLAGTVGVSIPFPPKRLP